MIRSDGWPKGSVILLGVASAMLLMYGLGYFAIDVLRVISVNSWQAQSGHIVAVRFFAGGCFFAIPAMMMIMMLSFLANRKTGADNIIRRLFFIFLVGYLAIDVISVIMGIPPLFPVSQLLGVEIAKPSLSQPAPAF